MIQQIVFFLILTLATWMMIRRLVHIKRTISLGKSGEIAPSPNRWRNVLLVAFGQRKMFQKPIPALLHFLVYAGFLIVNIEVLEIVLDGLLGTHRIVSGWVGSTIATFVVNFCEVMAAGVILACVVFLIRRNVLKIRRFHSREMGRWPTWDANMILLTEIALMLAFLLMNSSDQLLMDGKSHQPFGSLVVSSLLTPALSGFTDQTLHIIERISWWFHIIGIFGFAIYVTYSKHLHIFLAFPNTYFAKLSPKGQMDNMPVITNEVKSMLGLGDSTPPASEPGRFGAKDVCDLDQTSLLAAYSCTECGRCTASCPANITGKVLSPRHIMMATRDRLEDAGKQLQAGKQPLEDGKSLLDDYITREEVNACTSCQACVEACPILINPMEIILELRRYVAMEESASPASWNAMFQNIETNFAPWKFPTSDRFNWPSKG